MQTHKHGYSYTSLQDAQPHACAHSSYNCRLQCSPHLHTLHTHMKPRATAGAEGWRLWGPKRDTCALWAQGLVCLESGVRGRQIPGSWRSQLWQRLTGHLPRPTLRGLHGLRENREVSQVGAAPAPALRSDVAVLQEGPLPGPVLLLLRPGSGRAPTSLAPRLHISLLGQDVELHQIVAEG